MYVERNLVKSNRLETVKFTFIIYVLYKKRKFLFLIYFLFFILNSIVGNSANLDQSTLPCLLRRALGSQIFTSTK